MIITFKGGVGASTIDYIAVPYGLLDDVISCEVLVNPILNTSDHRAVRVTMKHDYLDVNIPTPEGIKNIKWNKINDQVLQNAYTIPAEVFCHDILGRVDIDSMGPNEIDTTIDLITSKLVNLGESLPRAKYRKHVRPYWNATLTQLKREKVLAHRLWKNEGCVRDPNNAVLINHKNAKRNFRRELKKVQRVFEKKQVQELINTAECDRIKFWKLVKNARQTNQSTTFSIKNKLGKVVHEIGDVVEVWRDHFSRLSKPKIDPNFDNAHYEHVTERVREWYNERDVDIFLEEPFNIEDISKAIKRLNKGKAAGCDSVTAEHLQKAGHSLIVLLTRIFVRIVEIEYIPQNFRKGTQIPLYKGKNTCTLDPNNYRGITLLTSLNKVFEILIWERLKGWWEDVQVISPLQGACRSGRSCLHSALTLQETISVGLGTRKRVLVSYL